MRTFTVSGLSLETSSDRRTIRKWLKNTIPAGGDAKSPEYTLEQYQEAKKLHETAGEGLKSLKEQKTAEEVRKLKSFNDERDGILVLKAPVIESIGKMAAKFAEFRQQQETRLPSKLVGINDIAEMRGHIKAYNDEVTRFLRSMKEELENIGV